MQTNTNKSTHSEMDPVDNKAEQQTFAGFKVPDLERSWQRACSDHIFQPSKAHRLHRTWMTRQTLHINQQITVSQLEPQVTYRSAQMQISSNDYCDNQVAHLSNAYKTQNACNVSTKSKMWTTY